MDSPPEFRGAASRLAARVTGSRFAALVARAVLVAAGVAFLAVVGYAAGPRALASSAGAEALAAATGGTALSAPPGVEHGARPQSQPAPQANAADSPPPPAPAEAAHSEPPPASAGHSPHGTASPDDPVVLNTATVDDFRRLPGIGEKRAAAMIALRERLGRFRAVEDLLKVKGIGRAMLKRIRPLVRLDPRLVPSLDPTADAGA
jgi:competence protein ComEA